MPSIQKYLIGKFSWMRLARSTFIIYSILCIYAFGFTDSKIFLPPPSSYQTLPQTISLTATPGTTITAQYFPHPTATYTLLYSHGNAEDLGMIQPVLNHLYHFGFSVLAYDYQGYGTSQGKPTERGSYQDIQSAYDYLTQTLKIPPHRIILYGRSVGGGPSVHLAAQTQTGGLIVENTFVSAFRVVTRISLFPFDKFNNIAKIRRVSCPLLIFHATLDEMIPFRHGEQLFRRASDPKVFVPIEGLQHNDWMGSRAEYNQSLREFVQEIEKGKAVREVSSAFYGDPQ